VYWVCATQYHRCFINVQPTVILDINIIPILILTKSSINITDFSEGSNLHDTLHLELQQVLCLVPSVCVFCLRIKYLGESLNGFVPNSNGRHVWSLTCKGHQGQKQHFLALLAACKAVTGLATFSARIVINLMLIRRAGT